MKKRIVIIILAILFGILIWQINATVFLADYFYKKARLAEQNGDWPQTINYYQQVFSYQPAEPKYHSDFAFDLLQNIDLHYSNQESKVQILQLAVQQMQSIPPEEQLFEVKSYLAQILAKQASLTEIEEDFQTAEQAFARAAAISPQMAGIYNDWCQLKIYEEDWPAAKEMCLKAGSFYPDLNDPRMNAQHYQLVIAEMSQVYEKMGRIYSELDNFPKAEEMYLQVLKFAPLSRPDVWKKIADLYYQQGDLATAVQRNLHGWTLNPDDPTWPFVIALLYQEQGQAAEAHFYAEQVLKLVPGHKQAQALLEKLEQF